MREFGPPEVMRLEEMNTPVPGPGEVLIRVHAGSVNRTLDLAVRAGTYPARVELPHILGVDPSGVVTAIGAGVTARKVGDRVATRQLLRLPTESAGPLILGVHAWGGYAEYVKGPVDMTHSIPEGLDFVTATVVARHGPTALSMLRDVAKVKPDDWGLVMGASGGLGSAGIQIARGLGAKGIAAAGADPRRRSRALQAGRGGRTPPRPHRPRLPARGGCACASDRGRAVGHGQGRAPARRGSVVSDPAVDVNGLAGDEPGVVADEEQARCSDFIDGALPPKRNARGARRSSLIPLGIRTSGVDTARRDHVDPDVVRRELGGETPRQAHQAHLRRGDVRAPTAADEGAFAREEHDAPVSVGDHGLDDRPRAIQRPVQYDAPHCLPVLHCQLREGLVRPNRRIADEDVDTAKFRQRPRDHPLNLIPLGNVRDHRDGLDPAGLSLPYHGVSLCLVGAVVDDDVGAFRRELQDRRSADIPTRACDERDLAIELPHEPPPSSRWANACRRRL